MKCIKCKSDGLSKCVCFKRCSKCSNITSIVKQCGHCLGISNVDSKILALSLNEYVKISDVESKKLAKNLFEYADKVRDLYEIDVDAIEYSEDAIQKIIDQVYKRNFSLLLLVAQITTFLLGEEWKKSRRLKF